MYGDKSELSRGGDAKDAMASGDVAMAVDRDKTRTTGCSDRVRDIGMEVAEDVRSRSLCTTVKMSTRTVEIMMKGSIDLLGGGVGGRYDLLKETRGCGSGWWWMVGSLGKELINRAGRAAGTSSVV